MTTKRLFCVLGVLLRRARSDLASSALAICALLALGTSACTEREFALLSANTTVIGKCSFTGKETSDIEPGNVFLYALRDDDDRSLSVVTGMAAVADSLLDVTFRQTPADILPARRIRIDRLEFGGLAVDRAGKADHFVRMGNTPGEQVISLGTTYGTQIAYPTCVFQ